MISDVSIHRPQERSNFRVEVSGWDASETFFYEKSILCADGEAQQICLNATLRKGSVIFVRLLRPVQSDENFPILYMVMENLPVDTNGRTMNTVKRMHPTPSYRQTVTAIDEHRRHVA